jgi:hypothetical protein
LSATSWPITDVAVPDAVTTVESLVTVTDLVDV